MLIAIPVVISVMVFIFVAIAILVIVAVRIAVVVIVVVVAVEVISTFAVVITVGITVAIIISVLVTAIGTGVINIDPGYDEAAIGGEIAFDIHVRPDGDIARKGDIVHVNRLTVDDPHVSLHGLDDACDME